MKKSRRNGKKTEITMQNAKEAVLVEAKEPLPPENLSEEEIEKVRGKADELVKQLAEVAGSKEMELLDGITNIGLQAQRNAASQMDLLKTPMTDFLKEGGTSKEIANGLRELQLTLNEINPGKVSRSGFAYGIIGILPFLKGRYNPITRALSKIALRYEPVSRQIAAIESQLRRGRSLLVRDNVELRKLFEDVETQQLSVRRNVYLGELLMQRLSEFLERTDDSVKRDRVQGALHDVVVRVQDLRTMEEVHAQYFVSIEMTRQNNTRLGQSVDRTLTLTTNVITIGLAIQMALIRQRKIIEATRRTREFLGELIASNASAIRCHTEDIGNIYNDPVIAIEKITQAHNDLVEALNTAANLRQEGIKAAQSNIAQLKQLLGGLEEKIAVLRPEDEEQPVSVEA